jgi:predicted RNase H-like nuclease (RuvC/YqgF family)
MGVKYDPITGMPSNEDTNYNKLLEMWRDEKKKRQEAEGENTIIKGIGNNSPEMKALQQRVKELENSLSIALDINDKYQREENKLKAELAREKEDRQYDDLVHKRELADLFKGKYEKE